MTFTIDTSEFDRDAAAFLRGANAEFTLAAERVAEEIVARAQTNAPKRFGTLQGSSFVDPGRVVGSSVEVEFGFSAPHADVMDVGFKVREIRPVRAKALFIPISRRGARAGGNVAGGAGLVEGVDYVFRARVRTPSLRKGPGKGPNRYFSDAVEEDSQFAADTLGTVITNSLRKLAGGQ